MEEQLKSFAEGYADAFIQLGKIKQCEREAFIFGMIEGAKYMNNSKR
jgi:hypothetical protein